MAKRFSLAWMFVHWFILNVNWCMWAYGVSISSRLEYIQMYHFGCAVAGGILYLLFEDFSSD